MSEIPSAAESKPEPKLSQTTYKPTKFEVAGWEIIGKIAEEYHFEPIDIEVVSAKEQGIDPMFANYGNGKDAETVRKWHSSMKEEVAAEPKFSITEQEVAKKVKEAEEKGRAAALAESKTIREQELTKLSNGLTETIKNLQKETEAKLVQLEKDAIKLSVDMARKIIEQAVEINPEYIIEIIKQGLGLAGTATIKKIKISAQDMEFIEVMQIAKKLKEYDGSWEFESDPTIKAGCIVETTAGEVDFQLDKAFASMADLVVKVAK